ncbi:MAG: reverse transcriptase domain-containing protein [Candidatus Thiodiazotropha sp.]
MVKEYERIPIASDSEDEKRIYKAEARATRKMKSERSKRGRGRGWPYRSRRQTETSAINVQGKPQETKRPGLCFSCGLPGHWAKDKECQGSKSNNKISIDDAIKSCSKVNASCDAEEQFLSQQYQGKSAFSFVGDIDEVLPKCQGMFFSHTENVSSQCENVTSTKTEALESVISIGHSNTTSLEAEQLTQEKTEDLGLKVCSPVGRLKDSVEKWQKINASSYILNVIEKGYRLPLKTNPQKVCLKNNRSAMENPSFVVEEIGSLLKKGVISECKTQPLVINPLTVAYSKTGKPRMVLDCRHINPHLHKFKFKYEDIKVAESMFEKGAYLFTFDLKGAYHHIPILEENRTYLGFSWTVNKVTKFYIFNVLPFGISTAGHIFSKVLREPVKYWRSLGYKVIMFLDDGIGGSSCFETAVETSRFVRNSIIEFGFLLANEKCNWEPVRQVVWLGHLLNMNEHKLYITEERIRRLEIFIDSIMFQLKGDNTDIVKVRLLASAVGQVISLQGVLGKSVRLRTRELYNCILSKASWNAPVKVTQGAKNELIFWRENARLLNREGKQIKADAVFDLRMYADASSYGYGGYLDESLNGPEKGIYEMKKGLETPEVVCVTGKVSPEVSSKIKVYSDLDVSDRETLELGCSVPPEVGRSVPPEVGSSVPPEVGGSIPPEVGSSVPPEVGCGIPPEVGLSVKFPERELSRNLLVSSGISSRGEACLNASRVNGREACGQQLSTEELSNSAVVGSWNKQEKAKSSTWREVEAVRRVLQSNVKMLRNKSIKVLSDNKNVGSVLQIGSRKSDLQVLALDVHHICKREGITIYPDWIPRGGNLQADNLSRCTDSDDWSIKMWVFNLLDRKWGPHSVDRFASNFNNKCVRFNSRWWVPGTEAIDSLGENWAGENNWVVPPPRLVLTCINKVEAEKANCTLVIPEWKSAPYWPVLFKDQQKSKYYMSQVLQLPLRNIIDAGFSNNGIFQLDPLPFRMIAVRIEFKG